MAREIIKPVLLRPREIKSLIPGRLARSQLTCPSTRKVRDESVVSLCSEHYNASTGSPWPSGPKRFDRLFSICNRQLAGG